jgi:hypothetical protein
MKAYEMLTSYKMDVHLCFATKCCKLTSQLGLICEGKVYVYAACIVKGGKYGNILKYKCLIKQFSTKRNLLTLLSEQVYWAPKKKIVATFVSTYPHQDLRNFSTIAANSG